MKRRLKALKEFLLEKSIFLHQLINEKRFNNKHCAKKSFSEMKRVEKLLLPHLQALKLTLF